MTSAIQKRGPDTLDKAQEWLQPVVPVVEGLLQKTTWGFIAVPVISGLAKYLFGKKADEAQQPKAVIIIEERLQAMALAEQDSRERFIKIQQDSAAADRAYAGATKCLYAVVVLIVTGAAVATTYVAYHHLGDKE